MWYSFGLCLLDVVGFASTTSVGGLCWGGFSGSCFRACVGFCFAPGAFGWFRAWFVIWCGCCRLFFWVDIHIVSCGCVYLSLDWWLGIVFGFGLVGCMVSVALFLLV